LSDVAVHAIVLNRKNSGESDRRLTLFTAELGKLEATAKGARKPKSRLASTSEPLAHAAFVLTQTRKTRYVTQVEMLGTFRHLRDDIDRLYFALSYAELLETVLPYEQPAPEMYSFALDAFGRLGTHQTPLIVYLWASVRLLDLAGFLPSFEICVASGSRLTQKEAYYSFDDGGYISDRGLARETMLVNGEVLIGLARLNDCDEPPERMKHSNDAFRLIVQIWKHIAEKQLKALEALVTSQH